MGHPALSASFQAWLHMWGDFYSYFPGGSKSCLGHPHLFKCWHQSLMLGAAANASQCSKISAWLTSIRRLSLLILFTQVAPGPEA